MIPSIEQKYGPLVIQRKLGYRPLQEQYPGIAETESRPLDREGPCPFEPLHPRLAELLFHCRCEDVYSGNE